MNSLNNTSAVLRSLIVYAISVPLSILVGYTLTNPLDYQSIGFIGVLIAILVFPLLMKLHYPWLLFSWSCPLLMFFLPGRPNMFLVLVLASLSISILERILNARQRFCSAPQVAWPLMALLGVVVVTAELTGGFGMRSMGSDVYGGKKYAHIIIGILSFFAIIARPIPKEKAKLYVSLFLAGGTLAFIQDLYPLIPSQMHFIYLFFGANIFQWNEMGQAEFELGVTRLGGFATTGGAVANLMLAHYGVRGIFMSSKVWRPVVFGFAFLLIFLGGFRSAIVGMILVFGLLFWLEGLHRSRLVLPFAMAGMLGLALLLPLASHLPHTFQRAVAFLPVEIDAKVRMDADHSTQWRLDMWNALLPQIPDHLLLGKGLAIKSETFKELMGRGVAFKTVDPSQNALALANDFHSGPISVVLPFGIWGVLAWLWFWGGGFYVLKRNYKYGDPDMVQFNRFLLAAYVYSCFGFVFIYGDLSLLAGFCGMIGFSVALNHGVRGPGGKAASVADPGQPFPKPSHLIFRR